MKKLILDKDNSRKISLLKGENISNRKNISHLKENMTKMLSFGVS